MNSLRVDKAAKHLQEESNYAKYDVDGDGVVTDEELEYINNSTNIPVFVIGFSQFVPS